MRTSNRYRVCFTLTVLALLSFGGVLMNGCQSPISNTNTVVVGNVGTNAIAFTPTNLPPLPSDIYKPLVSELKKTTGEIHEAKTSETLLIVIVIVICGVNILIYAQVRKAKGKIEKPNPIDAKKKEDDTKLSESTAVKSPELDEPAKEDERLEHVLATASDQLEAIKNELEPFSEAVETTAKVEEAKKAVDEQRRHLRVRRQQAALARLAQRKPVIIKPKT